MNQRAVIVVGCVASLLWAASASATPHGVRLTLDVDPAHAMVVHWNSDLTTDNQVIYGTTADALNSTATATDTVTMGGSLGTAFRVTLTGLAPSTTYYYRIGPAGGPYYPTGLPLQMRTLPADPCARVRVLVVGDNRIDVSAETTNPVWNGVLGEALAATPDLFINTGDMVLTGDNADEWRDFIDGSEIGMATVPTVFVIGNHDVGPYFTGLFGPPGAVDGVDYRSHDIGPVHLVAVSSENGFPSAAFTTMLAWLDQDLAGADHVWKIVAFHRAIYTRGPHHSGEDANGLLNLSLIPIFDAHHVDLVTNGHSHDYERFAPSVGVDQAFGGTGRSFPAGPGATLPAAVPNGDVGTSYMVCGGAGALNTDVLGYTCLDAGCTYCTGVNVNCSSEVFDNDKTANVIYDGRHSFLIMDVEGNTLTFEGWATNAGNGAPPEIIDSFSMSRVSSGLTCAPTADGGHTDGAPIRSDGGPSHTDPAPSPQPGDVGTLGNPQGCGCGASGGGCEISLMILVTLLARRRFQRIELQSQLRQS